MTLLLALSQNISFVLFFGVIFLVGFLLLSSFFKKYPESGFGKALLSFGVGIGALDFLMISLGKAGIPLSSLFIFLGLSFLSVVGYLIYRYTSPTIESTRQSLRFSNTERWAIFFILLLTLFIKTIYLTNAVVPTATDLGHHMYWAKLISVTEKLPVYAKKEIAEIDEDRFSLTEPEPIADFIIGEHLPFSAFHTLTGLDFFSAFPVLFLFVINILGLLALALLGATIARHIPIQKHLPSFSPEIVFIATLFLLGPLYTLASPQAKFVSGGVVGNMFGNFFIPLILFSFLRGITERRSGYIGVGFFLTFTLAYTHHLSTLILIYILAATTIAVLISHRGTIQKLLRSWISVFFRPAPLLVAFFACAFFFLVAMPTYIETKAVGTAIGTPTKVTRIGLSIDQITETGGLARIALAGFAFIFLLPFFRKNIATSLLFGWTVIVFIMSYRPDLVYLDIPSNRIGTYFSFPVTILAAFGLSFLFSFAKSSPSFLSKSALVIMLLFASASGFFENNQTLLSEPKSKNALETFLASRYLARHITPADVILKDHNYIVADSWMKLFFLQDYSFPLSRGFFSRYANNADRERCTLNMISIPNTPEGKRCFDGTNTNLVVVNPIYDAAQFEKSPDFSLIYSSDTIHIYERHQ